MTDYAFDLVKGRVHDLEEKVKVLEENIKFLCEVIKITQERITMVENRENPPLPLELMRF